MSDRQDGGSGAHDASRRALDRVRGSRSRTVAAHLPRSRQLRLGVVVVGGLGVLALLGPELTPYDPATQVLGRRLEPPSASHPLGTDALGRDVATRIVYGARVSLALSVAVVAVRLVVGTAIGVVAGYAGGVVDSSLMRVVDIQLAFPGLVLALVVAGLLGPSLANVLIALSIVGWATYARVVRGSVLSIKERPFVRSARLYGAPPRRIVRRHVLPGVAGPVVVLATMNLGTVVLTAAGLSFLGLGAQPPTAEWGTMIADGRRHLRAAPWLTAAPGVAIMLTVIGFNLLGDGLRDSLDADALEDTERRFV